MVVTVSLTFLILTVPNGVGRALKPVIDLGPTQSPVPLLH